jgi:DNA-binding CsgD family transcriptional regulator
VASPPPLDVATVKRYVDAFNRRDVDSLVEIMHPAAAILPGSSPVYAPAGTTYHGHAGTRSLVETILARAPGLRLELLMLRSIGDRLLVTFALDDGAGGENDASREVTVLYQIADGRILRSHAFASEREAARAAESSLTPREREVFRLLAAGMNAWQIAEQLEIAPDTVRTHVRNGVVKLGAKTRVQAVALALTLGEIEA